MRAWPGPLACAILALSTGAPGAADRGPAQFTMDGALIRPEGYREWILAGASLGLGYSEGPGASPELFHNVYVDRRAYAQHRRDGTFPEGTVLVLELFRPGAKATPARTGRYEAERVGLEAAVKDRARFDGGWAYFGFGDGSLRQARAFPAARCAACHRAHAATDNVFTQFYPALRAD